MMVLAKVTLKKGILDPQGKAVEHSLQSLGFAALKSARIGKLIELEVDAATKEEAKAAAEEMCEKLLANPVTEDFEIEVL